MALVNYFANLRTHTGCREERIEAKKLSHIFRHIQDKYGADAFRAARQASVYLNGVNWLFIPESQRIINSESVIDIFPPVAGG